jgi:hypothetical protein
VGTRSHHDEVRAPVCLKRCAAQHEPDGMNIKETPHSHHDRLPSILLCSKVRCNSALVMVA